MELVPLTRNFSMHFSSNVYAEMGRYTVECRNLDGPILKQQHRGTGQRSAESAQLAKALPMGLDGSYDSQLPLGAAYQPPIKNIWPAGAGRRCIENATRASGIVGQL